jgi:hypothetical protein
MEREIENMRLLAKPFIQRESFEGIIPQWKQQLLSFNDKPIHGTFSWNLPEGSPIKTINSSGEYEPEGRKGRLTVFGTISSRWDIRAEPGVRAMRPRPQCFILLGLASTKIRIWSLGITGQTKEIARWTLEIGDSRSPGCHFHTQIDLEDEDNKFPKALSVPRFPGFLHTPMDALDFLLGELFQDGWYRRTSEQSDFVTNWRGCQKPRLVAVLGWQREKIQAATGSPWTSFKREKPELDLLSG